MLYAGLSGLQAHQRALDVTSHNIANATTPGYTRQIANLTTNTPELSPQGMIGTGVSVDSIRRMVDNLLVERGRKAQSEGARLDQMQGSLEVAQSTFNEPGDNVLSAMINKAFSSFQDLSNSPESSALRSTVVQQLGSFTDTMNGIGRNLRQQRDDLANALKGQVAETNQLTSQIAKLNQQIREQTLRGAHPNDLQDQRDTLVGKLSQKMNLNVRQDADGTMRIDSGGVMLVGNAYAETLGTGKNADGSSAILLSNGTGIQISGGSIGALMDLHDQVIPGLQDAMDTLATTLAGALNAQQSTGTSNSALFSSFVSNFAIDSSQYDINLDSTSQIQTTVGGTGMAKAFMPSFTDANGVDVPRNLTINVYDPTTKTAQKYIVRFDPATAGGTRSLHDLVSAINSGRSTVSGGFTLYPPSQGGIPNLTAKTVTVDGGVRLELTATNGHTLDFSQALDLAPASTAWTGTDTTVAGSDVSLANQRLVVRINGTNVQAYTTDPATGNETLYAQTSVGSLSAAPTALQLPLGGNSGITLAIGTGTLTSGDSFAVDFNASGAIDTVSGTQTQAHQWTTGDAGPTVSGRYTGAVTYAPGREWSMRVVTPGTIGSSTNPPMVEFSYFTGPADAPVQQTMQKTLDSNTPAGSPISIADGVYVTIPAGSLSTAGNQVSWIVDAQPDQAKLLPALGINTLLSGTDAETLGISDAIQQNASRLAVGQTRSPGDNSNLLAMSGVRNSKLFNNYASGLDDFYSTTVANLGVQVAQNKSLQNTQQSLQLSLENQRQQVSGVSIDQEVTYLIAQQQAYTAAARLISTARENVQTLLQLVQ